jgi:hypothetical protein
MDSLSIRGTEAFSTPMAKAAENEAAERLPDNEATENTAASRSSMAPLGNYEGSLLDVTA